jgi:hypothetical protein
MTSAATPEIARPEHSPSLRAAWADRFLGSDPGLSRLIHAFQEVISLAAGLAVMWLFVRQTGALMMPVHSGMPAQSTMANAVNREMLISALALGAVAAILMGSAMSGPKTSQQPIGVLYVPAGILGGLALGMALHSYRVPSLAMFVVLLAGRAYLRRFGPHWFHAGIVIFAGYLIGFLMHGAVGWGGFGWMAAEAGVGAVTGALLHLLVFNPLHHHELGRFHRSYVARVRKTARLALASFDEPDGRAGRRVRRELIRLNEAALMIDAILTASHSLPHGVSASRVHAQIFDIELALDNTVRLAHGLARMNLPEAQRGVVRQALLQVAEGNMPAARNAAADLSGMTGLQETGDPPSAGRPGKPAVVAHRLAGTLADLADALEDWSAGPSRVTGKDEEGGAFSSPAMLAQGRLVGSATVSGRASTEAGQGRMGRVRLTMPTRTAIQVTVAAAVAVAAGDALNGTHFYWALTAVFAGFMGTSNSGEQTRKMLFRVAGTIIGAGLGIGLVHAVGHDTAWSLTIILVCWFLCTYLMQVNYTLFVIFFVTVLSQLYSQIGEFTNTLLLIRLAETSLGAAIIVLTVLIVVPLRPRRILRVALRLHFSALGTLVEHAADALLSTDMTETPSLRGDIRVLDAAHYALVSTAEPLRPGVFGEFDGQLGKVLGLASACRHYARLLAADIPVPGIALGGAGEDLQRAARTLRSSIGQVADTLNGQRDRIYVRSASLIDNAERDLPARTGTISPSHLALRDLRLIDEAAASLASALSMTVASYDIPPDTDTLPSPGSPDPAGAAATGAPETTGPNQYYSGKPDTGTGRPTHRRDDPDFGSMIGISVG